MGAGDGLPFNWTQSYQAQITGKYYRWNDITLTDASWNDIAWKATDSTATRRIIIDHVELCVFPYASRATSEITDSSRTIKTKPPSSFLYTAGGGPFSYNFTGSGVIAGYIPFFATRFEASGMSTIPGHGVGVATIGATNPVITSTDGTSSSTTVMTISKGWKVITALNETPQVVTATNTGAASDAIVLPAPGSVYYGYKDNGSAWASGDRHTYGPWVYHMGHAGLTGVPGEYQDFSFLRVHMRGVLFNNATNASATDLLVSISTGPTEALLPFSHGDAVILSPG